MTIPVWGYGYENLASSDVYARCIGLQHRRSSKHIPFCLFFRDGPLARSGLRELFFAFCLVGIQLSSLLQAAAKSR